MGGDETYIHFHCFVGQILLLEWMEIANRDGLLVIILPYLDEFVWFGMQVLITVQLQTTWICLGDPVQISLRSRIVC